MDDLERSLKDHTKKVNSDSNFYTINWEFDHMNRHILDDKTELTKALHAVHQEVGLVGKSGNNTFDRYTYAKLEDYLKVVKNVAHKHGIFIMESIDSVKQIDGRVTKDGSPQNAFLVELSFIISHKSGQQIVIKGYGEGQDRGDKSIYKAITGARKYAVALAFNLVTTDDVEADEKVSEDVSPQKSFKKPASKPATKTPRRSPGKPSTPAIVGGSDPANAPKSKFKRPS